MSIINYLAFASIFPFGKPCFMHLDRQQERWLPGEEKYPIAQRKGNRSEGRLLAEDLQFNADPDIIRQAVRSLYQEEPVKFKVILYAIRGQQAESTSFSQNMKMRIFDL